MRASAATTRPVMLSAETKVLKTPLGLNPVPSLTPFYPDAARANGAAVVVCPGGGYGGLMDTYEGADVCRWWNERGVTAFLLRYRIAPDRYPAGLDDARRAIRVIRERAADFGVNPKRVGIMGFSAGGHLAASTATLAKNRDERPDFAILVYPVISLVAPYGHFGSRDNLLGASPRPGLAEELSLETRVTANTPPCFLVHGRNDKVVDWRNSQLFYDALREHGVAGDLVLLNNGPHGFGLKTPGQGEAPWTEESLRFLQSIRMIPSDKQ